MHEESKTQSGQKKKHNQNLIKITHVQYLFQNVVIHFNTLIETNLTLKLPDQICNSPYYQPYSSYNINSEN